VYRDGSNEIPNCLALDEILGIRYNLASWAAQQVSNRCRMNYYLKDNFCLEYRKILLVLFQFCNYLLSLLAG
jgi:hypothetical protein